MSKLGKFDGGMNLRKQPICLQKRGEVNTKQFYLNVEKGSRFLRKIFGGTKKATATHKNPLTYINRNPFHGLKGKGATSHQNHQEYFGHQIVEREVSGYQQQTCTPHVRRGSSGMIDPQLLSESRIRRVIDYNSSMPPRSSSVGSVNPPENIRKFPISQKRSVNIIAFSRAKSAESFRPRHIRRGIQSYTPNNIKREEGIKVEERAFVREERAFKGEELEHEQKDTQKIDLDIDIHTEHQVLCPSSPTSIDSIASPKSPGPLQTIPNLIQTPEIHPKTPLQSDIHIRLNSPVRIYIYIYI